MSDMLVKLYALPGKEPVFSRLKGTGILVRRAKAYDKISVLQWVREVFPRWESECDVAFSNVPISCYVAMEGEKVIGFACHESTCRGFFGPIGVQENKRGQGLGRALLLACLHAMAQLGYAYAVIGGGGGDGTREFYSRSVGATEIEGSTPGYYGYWD